MKTILFWLLISSVYGQLSPGETFGRDEGRYLILNFDCHGDASGTSSAIGDSLRFHVGRQGGRLVSRDLFEKVMSQKGLNESDLNYTINELKALMVPLSVTAVVYGHVYSSQGLLTAELRYIETGTTEPILFDPIVCGSISDLYSTIPGMAQIILSPDKTQPYVVSVEPPNGEIGVGQYVDVRITFSEPMNPVTFSISGLPEGMWKRYGDFIYDEKTCSFTFNLHLYPDINYEFHINGEDSKGFKDLAGNPAQEYVWFFSTGRR